MDVQELASQIKEYASGLKETLDQDNAGKYFALEALPLFCGIA
jgi:hypothetical protein